MLNAKTPGVTVAWIERLSSVTPPDAIEEHADIAGAWYELGAVTRDVKYRDRSKQLLSDLIQRYSTSATAYYARAMIHEQEGDATAAEADYR